MDRIGFSNASRCSKSFPAIAQIPFWGKYNKYFQTASLSVVSVCPCGCSSAKMKEESKPWKEIEFDEAISLGSWCLTSHQLKRMQLKRQSYPFDWVVAPAKCIRQCLEDRCKTFLDRSLVKKKRNTKIPGCIYHHLEGDEFTDSEHRYYVRCVNRLYSTVAQHNLFIYIEQGAMYPSSLESITSLTTLLQKDFPLSRLLYVRQYSSTKLSSPTLVEIKWDWHESFVVCDMFVHAEALDQKKWDQASLHAEWKRLLSAFRIKPVTPPPAASVKGVDPIPAVSPPLLSTSPPPAVRPGPPPAS